MTEEKYTLKILKYDDSIGLYYAVDEYNDMYVSSDLIEWRELTNIEAKISGIYLSDSSLPYYIIYCEDGTVFRTKTFKLDLSTDNLIELKSYPAKKNKKSLKMKFHAMGKLFT